MNDNWLEEPLGCFVTFRTYGTWLHGDVRTSVDRRQNVYGTPRIPPNPRWSQFEARVRSSAPVILNSRQRRVVDDAIRETCAFYDWHLFALNVRTNHVHSVVAAPVSATRVVASLKAYATRRMRLADCWPSPSTPWSYGASKRYLWSSRQLERAIIYVLNGQGDPLD